MSLDAIAARMRDAGPADAALPLVDLTNDADAAGLVAWFGADSDRGAARVAISGEYAGVIERAALYELVADRTLGWGDSIGTTLPGHPAWKPVELHCPIGSCPHSPMWVLTYDPGSPPTCAAHPNEVLAPHP